MKKINIFLMVVFISALALGVVILLNINNSNHNTNNNNDLIADSINNTNTVEEDYRESEITISVNTLLDIPSPNEVVFYRDGKEYIFEYGSKEYKKIIELNTFRDSKINYTKCSFHSIEDIKNKIDLLEYRYIKNDSIYFNLTGIYDYIGVDGSTQFNGSPEEKRELFWVYNLGNYGYGLKSSNELVEYINSII